MAMIGSFKQDGYGFAGVIGTSTMNSSIRLTYRHQHARLTPTSPARSTSARPAPKSSNDGRSYLSASLVDQSFPAAIYATLTEDAADAGKEFLIWSRKPAE